MELSAHVKELVKEAKLYNERRLVVISDQRKNCYELLLKAFRGLRGKKVLVTNHKFPQARDVEVHSYKTSDKLGTTQDFLALDLHDSLTPSSLGKLVGAVRGGGILFLLTPSRSGSSR